MTRTMAGITGKIGSSRLSEPGAIWLVALLVLTGMLWAGAAAAQLDDSCVVSALNRTAPVQADGSWVLPNIPANFGQVRVRATCTDADGSVLRSGQSDFVTVPVNGVLRVPEIVFDAPEPVPATLALSAPVEVLNAPGEVVQLSAVVTFPDGSSRDVTTAAGTTYTLSNPGLATLDGEGRLTAAASGSVLISALYEGALGVLTLRLVLSGDSDGDGLPDDFEVAAGLDPNNPADALSDPDEDALTVLEEFQAGLDPFDPDSDDDRLLDGREVFETGTDPLLFDTDGDLVSDGLEVLAGSDPLDRGSVNLGPILNTLDLAPASFTLFFDAVVGEASRQLRVTGTLIDGTSLDITAPPYGTVYASSDLTVISFGLDAGRVFAGRDGIATVTASNGAFSASIQIQVESFAPQALAFLRIPGFANGVAVEGDHAYVAAGAAGLVVVDVSDLRAPFIAGSVDTPGNANDVRVQGGLVYVADGAAGLAVIDASDPAAPGILGTVDTPGTATDLAVVGSRVYVADGTAGLEVIDASDPAAPVVVGSVNTPGNARGVDAEGSLVVVADAGGGVQVIDASNPASPFIAGSTHTRSGFSRAADVAVREGLAYVADGSGSLGGVKVIDFRDPATPVVVGASGDSFGLAGIALEDQFALTADYFFPNGVPIFNVGDPRPVFSSVLNFSRAPSFRDDNGSGIAVQNGAVFLVGARWTIRDNGAWGDSALHIGRYRAEEDDAGIPPEVVLTAPEDGAAARERTSLTLRAEARDDLRVDSVTFLLDGLPVGTDFKSPYEVTVPVPAGAPSVRVGARAVDLGGNVGTAEEVELAVIPDDQPTVTLIAPAEGGRATQGTSLTLAATATDDVAVAKVELFVDGVRRGTRTAPPYRIDFTVPFGVSELTVEAVATDSVGQTAASGPRVVGIDPDLPPIVEVVQPPDGTEVVAGSRLRVVAGASDDNRVQRVRFLVGGAFFGEDFEAPYESEVTAPAVGSTLVISAIAEDNRFQQTQADVTVVGIPDPGTTVEGTVLRDDRTPAFGAEVTAAGVGGLTDEAGRFSLSGVPTIDGEITVRASLAADGGFLVGSSAPGTPVIGGVTEVGEILLFPGFPNGNGGFETGDFSGFSVAGETRVLSSLGPVTPPEGGFMGFLSTGGAAVGRTTSVITTEGFTVPEGVTFLAFDFNFLSNEFPSFVGSIFNDTLVVRLTTAGGTEEDLLASVNTSSFVQAPGTGFNGMTGFATVRLDVSAFAGSPDPCVVTFEIRVFDQGDTVVDSAGLIDNLRFE